MQKQTKNNKKPKKGTKPTLGKNFYSCLHLSNPSQFVVSMILQEIAIRTNGMP